MGVTAPPTVTALFVMTEGTWSFALDTGGQPSQDKLWKVYVKGQCFSAPNMQCVFEYIMRGDWSLQEGWLGSQGDSQGRNRVVFFFFLPLLSFSPISPCPRSLHK